MTSTKQLIGGYLKQMVGEVVGSQSLHETGKREVLGVPEDKPAKATTISAPDPSAKRDKPTDPGPIGPKFSAGARPAGSVSDQGRQKEDKDVRVFTQMLPEIEQPHGAFVKVEAEDDVLYVPIPIGATFQDAKDVVVKMATRLNAELEKSKVRADIAPRGGKRGAADAEDYQDLDQLEIGLLDSFPASDPPAASISTVLPKKYDP